MSNLQLEHEPVARRVETTANHLIVDLVDDRRLIVPLTWYPRLQHATDAERKNWQLLGDGYALEWPDIDEHIGIEGLLAGRRSGESAASLNGWLNSRTGKSKQFSQ
jgi:hypothetical protein